MRIIDADRLKAHYSWWKGGGREMTMDEAKNDFDTIIDLQPTVDPIKHGHWENKFISEEMSIDDVPWLISRCSVCKKKLQFATRVTAVPYDYCPNCGAKMGAQIGEDKSHPFAESVMMGMDGTSISTFSDFYDDKGRLLNNPISEAEPTKHGHWEQIVHPWYECSECGERTAVVNLNGKVIWNYCPNCGADMRGGENEANRR